MTKPTQIHTVVFTGPRPQNMVGWQIDDPLYNRLGQILLATIEKLIIQNGAKIFIQGGAAGWDLLAARAVMDAQHKGYDIELWNALPYRSVRFKGPWLDIYNKTLIKAKETIVLYEEPGENYRAAVAALFGRNKWMVNCMGDGNSMMISGHTNTPTGVYRNEQIIPLITKETKGGTANTIYELSQRICKEGISTILYNINPLEVKAKLGGVNP